jgi:hypothetical protein
MEKMARDAVKTIKVTSRAMRGTLARVGRWTLVMLLSLAAVVLALPRLQTAAAIALALFAYSVLTTRRGEDTGPYAGIAARVIRTQMLFIEDSAGKPLAWLGVEDAYGDEHGARLIFYDKKGRARLALRFADRRFEEDLDAGGRARAEVALGQFANDTYIPPPWPPGKPPTKEEDLRRRTEHAAHVAAVQLEMQSKHARDWADSYLRARREGQGHDPENAEHEEPELVMFDRDGGESVSLASGLTLTAAGDLATVTADSIFLMSDGRVRWEVPPPPAS